jgi:hypothetical protein
MNVLAAAIEGGGFGSRVAGRRGEMAFTSLS